MSNKEEICMTFSKKNSSIYKGNIIGELELLNFIANSDLDRVIAN